MPVPQNLSYHTLHFGPDITRTDLCKELYARGSQNHKSELDLNRIWIFFRTLAAAMVDGYYGIAHYSITAQKNYGKKYGTCHCHINLQN